VSRIESRSPATLPPVALTPEEAAAVAVALAAQPEGPYAAAGRGALAKIVEALEPDRHRRAQLLAAADRMGGTPRSAGHPAGRRRRPAEAGEAPRPPRLVVLPGGRS
jgi:predicted DNA-binding transcriptional regulator YafY